MKSEGNQFYCDFHDSAESHLQASTAKLRFGLHQLNFQHQAKSWPETKCFFFMCDITYQSASLVPTVSYNRTWCHRWKAMESVWRFLLKNLLKEIIMVFELWTNKKLQFTFLRRSQSSQLSLGIWLMEAIHSLALKCDILQNYENHSKGSCHLQIALLSQQCQIHSP